MTFSLSYLQYLNGGGRLVFKETSCFRNYKDLYNLAQINSEIDYQFEIVMLELMRQHVMLLL